MRWGGWALFGLGFGKDLRAPMSSDNPKAVAARKSKGLLSGCEGICDPTHELSPLTLNSLKWGTGSCFPVGCGRAGPLEVGRCPGGRSGWRMSLCWEAPWGWEVPWGWGHRAEVRGPALSLTLQPLPPLAARILFFLGPTAEPEAYTLENRILAPSSR